MAFHPYPQVIPPVFNLGGFGPPRGLTRASTCPWIDHSASGLDPATQSPYSDSLSLRLRLNALTSLLNANSQAHSSKGTLSPVTRTSSNGLYAHGFRYYFTPLPGYFSPFPHGTSPLSVIEEYLGLTGGPARFTPNFRGSVLLGMTQKSHELTCTGVSPSMPRLSSRLSLHSWFMTLCLLGRTDHVVPQHRNDNACRLSHHYGLAWSGFARHYYRNHFCFLFLWVLRCFTSPRSLQTPYVFRRRYLDFPPGGFPHSDIPGSQVGCHLPGAFRRLQRPSSALDAKASTMCT